MNTVARNIKKSREKAGLTQEELSGKLNITRQAISNWETGRSLPDINMLAALSEAFEVDIMTLIYGAKQVNGFDARRGERVKKTVVLSAILIVLIAAAVITGDRAEELKAAAYNIIPYMIFTLAVPQLIYILCAYSVFSVLAIWKDLCVKAKSVRMILTLSGLSIIAAYLLLVAAYLSRHMAWKILYWIIRNPAVLSPSGFLLFCGLNGGHKRKERADTEE